MVHELAGSSALARSVVMMIIICCSSRAERSVGTNTKNTSQRIDAPTTPTQHATNHRGHDPPPGPPPVLPPAPAKDKSDRSRSGALRIVDIPSRARRGRLPPPPPRPPPSRAPRRGRRSSAGGLRAPCAARTMASGSCDDGTHGNDDGGDNNLQRYNIRTRILFI